MNKEQIVDTGVIKTNRGVYNITIYEPCYESAEEALKDAKRVCIDFTRHIKSLQKY